MEFHFLPIITLLCLVLVGINNGSSPAANVYWESMLPNTPIPTALQELLPQAGDKSSASHDTSETDLIPIRPPRYNFIYGEAIKSLDENVIANRTIFFLYNDLHHPGRRMRLVFAKSQHTASFLTRQIADSIPFSSDKLPEILNRFSIKPKSNLAENMKSAIEDCEIPEIKGEDKYCATSLESLVDFIIAKLGRNVHIFSTEVQKESTNYKQDYYTILKGMKKIGDKQVVCHKEEYAYAVFFCHIINPTKAYMVPLMASDGSKVKAVALCHIDTSAWSPEHYAFQVLKVKPGETICHFLNTGNLVWVPT